MYCFENRVRYSEIDSKQKLTLSSLLDYMQDCCTFQSESLHVGVDYLAGHQVAWVLSSWQIQILRYPKFGEIIRVNTWPYGFKGFYGYRNFSIVDESGQMIVKANSVWVFMDTAKMRPMRITEDMKNAYQEEYEDVLSGPWEDRKIKIPETGVEREPFKVARFHIDTNHHMNNSKYVLAAEEYLPEDFEVKDLQVEYRRSAMLGDMLYPIVTTEDGTVTVVLSDAAKQPYAVVLFRKK